MVVFSLFPQVEAKIDIYASTGNSIESSFPTANIFAKNTSFSTEKLNGFVLSVAFIPGGDCQPYLTTTLGFDAVKKRLDALPSAPVRIFILWQWLQDNWKHGCLTPGVAKKKISTVVLPLLLARIKQAGLDTTAWMPLIYYNGEDSITKVPIPYLRIDELDDAIFVEKYLYKLLIQMTEKTYPVVVITREPGEWNLLFSSTEYRAISTLFLVIVCPRSHVFS